MFTNFSDFNFEVIDVLVNNITPELTINKNRVCQESCVTSNL